VNYSSLRDRHRSSKHSGAALHPFAKNAKGWGTQNLIYPPCDRLDAADHPQLAAKYSVDIRCRNAPNHHLFSTILRYSLVYEGFALAITNSLVVQKPAFTFCFECF
jgi:hypothetical protein